MYRVVILYQGADNQKYDEVPEIPRLLTIIEEYLGDYNAQVWGAGYGSGGQRQCSIRESGGGGDKIQLHQIL